MEISDTHLKNAVGKWKKISSERSLSRYSGEKSDVDIWLCYPSIKVNQSFYKNRLNHIKTKLNVEVYQVQTHEGYLKRFILPLRIMAVKNIDTIPWIMGCGVVLKAVPNTGQCAFMKFQSAARSYKINNNCN